MHLKNFSLLQTTKGEITLAPAYDLLPTNLLLPEDSEESALTINGKKRKLNSNDFQAFASKIKLSESQINNAFERILKKTQKATDLISNGLCSDAVIEQFIKLIQTRIKRLV